MRFQLSAVLIAISSFPKLLTSTLVVQTHRNTKSKKGKKSRGKGSYKKTPAQTEEESGFLAPSALQSKVPSTKPSSWPNYIPSPYPTGNLVDLSSNSPSFKPSNNQSAYSPSFTPVTIPNTNNPPSLTPFNMQSNDINNQSPSKIVTALPSLRLRNWPTLEPTLITSKTTPVFIPDCQMPSHTPSLSKVYGRVTSVPSVMAPPDSIPTSVSSDTSPAPSSETALLPVSIMTRLPTNSPSQTVTSFPSTAATEWPTHLPTLKQIIEPSIRPTFSPSTKHTSFSTTQPSEVPTPFSSTEPSVSVTSAPTDQPSEVTTTYPSAKPSATPTFPPSIEPTTTPSTTPSVEPSRKPTTSPSASPSAIPTVIESNNPSEKPTIAPLKEIVLVLPPTIAPTNTPSSTPSESYAPSFPCNIPPQVRSTQLLDIIRNISVSTSTFNYVDMIQYETTPHFRAASWLVHEDTFYICPSSSNVVQRYIVALIYFQMNGANWVNCAAAVDSPCQVDTQVLQGDHFLSASHECSWTFLICDSNERITNVEIDVNNLSGQIPKEIFALTQLTTLTMDGNKNITGTIPTLIGNLKHLKYLDLDDNNLNGTLPAELFTLTSLMVLDLDSNKLQGRIPTEMNFAANLTFIQLYDNELTGPIPDLSNLKGLTTLQLQKNSLKGTMPHSICGLPKLQHLWADCKNASKVVCPCCTKCDE